MSRQPTLDEFETHGLLDAVDALDAMRGILADGEDCRPPQLRIDLMNLHGVAMKVCNYSGNESRERERELFEAATEIEDEVEELRDAAERILDILRGITEANIEGSEDWY